MTFQIARWFLYLFCVFFFLFCNRESSVLDKTEKQIVPLGSASIVLQSAPSSQGQKDITPTVSQRSIRSFIPQDYIVLEYIKDSLNSDDIDEDIVLYTTYSIDTIYVFIASFDSVSNTYRFVWQSPTSVVSEKPLSLSVRDITGDGQKEIIVRGAVKKDESYMQSIEVFHMPNDGQYNISKYRKVFQNVTNSDIDIEDVQKGEALAIILYNVNEETKDIVKSFYLWEDYRNTYVYYKNVVFKHSDIVNQKIDSLYYGSTSQWQRYLLGMWQRTENDGYPNLLYFSLDLPHVTIYSHEKLQVMEWVRMVRIIDASGLGAQVYVRNMILPEIKKSIRIRIIDDKTLDVYMGNDMTGAKSSGRYRVIKNMEEIVKNIELFAPAVQTSLKNNNLFLSLLDGAFEDEQSKVLYIFKYPRLEIISPTVKKKEDFYFTIFNINTQKILQIKNTTKFYEGSRFYIIENTNEEMRLSPVRISFYNLYSDTNPSLYLVSTTR